MPGCRRSSLPKATVGPGRKTRSVSGRSPAATARSRAWVRATSRTGSSGCASVTSSTTGPLQLHEDRLVLEVAVEPGVPVLAAEPRGLEAAEGRRRVRRAPGVHVDLARAQQGGEAVG